MRKLPVTFLLWLFACTVSSDEIIWAQTESPVVELAVNTAEVETTAEEEAGSSGLTGTKDAAAVPPTSATPATVMEGVINDPPLEETQENVLPTTPAVAEQSSTPTGGITDAKVDFTTQPTPDLLSEGGLIQTALTTQTADSSNLPAEEEVAQEDAKSDGPGDLPSPASDLTTAQQSETHPPDVFTIPASPTAVITEEGRQIIDTTVSPLPLPQTIAEGPSVTTPVSTATHTEAMSDKTDDITVALVDPTTTSIQEALDEVTSEGEAISAASTTHGPSSLSEGTSVTPDTTTPTTTIPTSTPGQPDVLTTLLEDNIPGTALSGRPDPQLSSSTTANVLASPTATESVFPVEFLTQQPALESTDGSTFLPSTQSEVELSPSPPTTPAASDLTSSAQSSSSSTEEVAVLTDNPSISVSTVPFTTAEPTIESILSLSTDAATDASEPPSSKQSSSASTGEFTGITDDPSISVATVRPGVESIPSGVPTTVQTIFPSQLTDASSPSFATTLEELSPLTDFGTAAPLTLTYSTAKTSTDVLEQDLTSAAKTEVVSVVTLTSDRKLTDETQQTPTQAPYPPTSVQPPQTGSTIPSQITAESFASDGSPLLEVGSSSQSTEMLQSTTMSTTFKSTQETTYIQEVHTDSTAESTVDVGTTMSGTTLTPASATNSPADGSTAELIEQTEPGLLTTLISTTTSSEANRAGMSSSPFLSSSPIITTVHLPPPTTSAPSITKIYTPIPSSSVTPQSTVTTQPPTTTVSMPPSTVSLPLTEISPSSVSSVAKTSTTDRVKATDEHVSLILTTALSASLTSESIITTLPHSSSSGTTVKSEEVTILATDSYSGSSVHPDFMSSTGTPVSLTSSTPSAVVTTVEQQVPSTSPTSTSTKRTLSPMEIHTDSGDFTFPQTSTTQVVITTAPVVIETSVETQMPPTSTVASQLHTAHITSPTTPDPTTEQKVTPEVVSTTPKPTVTAEGTTKMMETSSSTIGPIPLPPKTSDVTQASDTTYRPPVVPAISKGWSIASAVSMGLIIIFVSILLCVFAISAVGGWLEYRKKQRRRRPQAVNLVRVERAGSEGFIDGWGKDRQQQQPQAWMTCQSAALQPPPPSGPRQEPLGGKLARQCSCKRRRFFFPGRHHSLCMLHSEVKQTEELRALRVISLSDEDEEAISSESMLLSGIGRRRVSGASDVELTAEGQEVPEVMGKSSPVLETEDGSGEVDSGKKKWLFIDEV